VMTYDPRYIRVKDGWVLVRLSQRKTVLDSGIVLPFETNPEKLTEGEGILVRVGRGKKNEALGLVEGQRICCRSYFKDANTVPTEEKWLDGSPKQYFILNVDDILGVIEDPNAVVGVFSRPSQSSVDSVDAEGNVKMRR
jgi:co-chaperonin GroES (HSP10)